VSTPTPYAFNYRLGQSGQFRGLAFANFGAASDADAVVAALNRFDVRGRRSDVCDSCSLSNGRTLSVF
jgi:hypothetical protein